MALGKYYKANLKTKEPIKNFLRFMYKWPKYVSNYLVLAPVKLFGIYSIMALGEHYKANLKT